MGGSSGGDSTTTFTLSPEQRKLIELGIPTFEGYINEPPEIGPRPVVPFNELQEAGQQSAIGNIGHMLARYEQGQQGLQGARNYFGEVSKRAFSHPGTGSISSFTAQANPYIERATQGLLNPLTEQLTQNILPQIRQGSIGSGSFGGSRQGLAEGSAVNQYVDRATQAVSPYLSNIYQQALGGDINAALQTQRLQSQEGQNYLNNATQLAELQPLISQLQARFGTEAGLLPASILSGIGGQQQFLQQQQEDSEYNARYGNQFLPFTLAQQVLHGGSGLPGGSSQTEYSRPSLLGSLLGNFF